MDNPKKIEQFLEAYGKLTNPMYHPDKEGGFKLVVQTQAIEVQEKPKESFISK